MKEILLCCKNRMLIFFSRLRKLFKFLTDPDHHCTGQILADIVLKQTEPVFQQLPAFFFGRLTVHLKQNENLTIIRGKQRSHLITVYNLFQKMYQHL